MEKPKLKLSHYKMTPEELQAHLKVRGNGGGVVKSKTVYSRKQKHKGGRYDTI